MFCRLCKKKKLFKFLDLGLQPPSDQFKFKSELNKHTKYYPLEVYLCRNCGFHQLGYIVNPIELYQNNYPYESSKTLLGSKHFDNFASSLIKKYKLTKKDLVVDIGSNVGILLKGLKKRKIKILGVDPAQNICKIANKKKIPTLNGFFEKKIIKKIIKNYGYPKVITATNVFAHIDNLNEFLKNIKFLLNKTKGVLIIESPYFLELINKLEYDTIYHEHLSYISINPLVKLFNKLDLEIIDIEQKDIHGGSIRIHISRKNNFEINPIVNLLIKRENKAKLTSKNNLNNFKNKVIKNRLNLIMLLTKLKLAGKKIAALSAPAKGMTLLNYCKIDSVYLDFATEKSKLKQDSFTPGTCIPVTSDKELLKKNIDYAILLAWNFSKEIIQNNKKFLKKGGKFIIPIPKIKIVSKNNYKSLRL